MLTGEHGGHGFEVQATSLFLRHSHFSQLVLFHDSPVYVNLKSKMAHYNYREKR